MKNIIEKIEKEILDENEIISNDNPVFIGFIGRVGSGKNDASKYIKNNIYKDAILLSNNKIRFYLTKNNVPYGEEYESLVSEIGKIVLGKLIELKANIILDANFSNKIEYKNLFEKNGYKFILIGLQQNRLKVMEKINENIKRINEKLDFKVDKITVDYRDSLSESDKIKLQNAIDEIKIENDNFSDIYIFEDIFDRWENIEELAFEYANFKNYELSDLEKQIKENL